VLLSVDGTVDKDKLFEPISKDTRPAGSADLSYKSPAVPRELVHSLDTRKRHFFPPLFKTKIEGLRFDITQMWSFIASYSKPSMRMP
jgi:hypothetical protein